jgi:NAD(P)-dependent dehydrogenase (short-subunit alcohol dehydrogenase family)
VLGRGGEGVQAVGLRELAGLREQPWVHCPSLLRAVGAWHLSRHRRTRSSDIASLDRQYAVNVGGVVAAVRAAVPVLGEGGAKCFGHV